jgi:hypothetical protein
MDWKALIEKLNKNGIPLPMARDPRTGLGSVSLTLVWISSIYVQLALVGRITNALKGVDIVNALYWFGICASLYYGRSLTKKKDELSISSDSPSDQK